ncbi:hypothetical protein, partial [Burkholderia contaminans]|uniref:hypothetical protein n=1 Tax=Burkholderia contaminans TaxID=488447 RepID=UPI001ABAD259
LLGDDVQRRAGLRGLLLARLHVAVLLGSLFGRLVLETRFSRIPLANRRLQPSTTPGTLPVSPFWIRKRFYIEAWMRIILIFNRDTRIYLSIFIGQIFLHYHYQVVIL